MKIPPPVKFNPCKKSNQFYTQNTDTHNENLVINFKKKEISETFPRIITLRNEFESVF
jgi:hypothetical protein